MKVIIIEYELPEKIIQSRIMLNLIKYLFKKYILISYFNQNKLNKNYKKILKLIINI